MASGPHNIVIYAVKWMLARIRKEVRAVGKILGEVAVDTSKQVAHAAKAADQEAKRLAGQAQAVADSAKKAAKDAEKVGQKAGSGVKKIIKKVF